MNPTKRVLAVDDEPHIRHVVELKLKGAGYDVVAATNGGSALELAGSHQPDLIVTDFQMPGTHNGIELIKAVREAPRTAETPIILLTGSVAVLKKVEHELADVEGVTFMSKPFSPRELVKQVRKLLGEG